ncbi:MAG: FMN-binding protein [Spirochaetae bacterium HGW-Spirochaetae-3]|jgi:uncharacterized protein with FMN-binding domain|nr:MAG: FMN-binding protein [Spirochaetae bacterium HGW-Spirochaetae-3]
MIKFRKSTVVIVVALVALYAIGKMLPRFIDSRVPSLRASTKAFSVSAVQNGVYEGRAFLLPVSVRVRATVSDGRIASIELLKHFNGQGKPAEAIVGDVIADQSLGVDVIAGATYSSLTILKAIENALSKGIER